MAESLWDQLATRLVDALGAQRGELIEVRDEAGNQRLLHAVLLALESIGAEPLAHILPAPHVERLLATTTPELLAERDRRREVWLQQVDRSLTLIGAQPDLSRVAPEALQTFAAACNRLAALREERRIPQAIAAIPTIGKAAQLGISHEELELRVMPALLAKPAQLVTKCERVIAALSNARALTITSGPGYELRAQLHAQPWVRDVGRIEGTADHNGAIVTNLPAGSLYTTISAESVEGDLFLPVAGPARAAHFHFRNGRVTQIEAASGGEQLAALLDQQSGEPRRIGVIGIGLNPYLRQSIGWTMVDKHVQGALFIGMGERRYPGGAIAHPLTIDFTTTAASLRADEQVILEHGQLVV
ncbi:aminopeptidase [Chloroflexus sp.]|uniref:aminopeptidase n=1 Tax=Chloroflexus sp. TaxID=1904827 RepID=UPI00261205A4|nr:aminopeptidase [uncultured Chloroflexus sp.]